MSSNRAVLLLVAPLAFSCGARTSDAETGKAGTASPANAAKPANKSEFFAQVVTVLCSKYTECGIVYPYAESCEKSLGDALQYSAILTHDEVHFDATAGAACLRLFDSSECKGNVEQSFGAIGAEANTCEVTFYGDADVDGPLSTRPARSARPVKQAQPRRCARRTQRQSPALPARRFVPKATSVWRPPSSNPRCVGCLPSWGKPAPATQIARLVRLHRAARNWSL